jgi:hypothetical protein
MELSVHTYCNYILRYIYIRIIALTGTFSGALGENTLNQLKYSDYPQINIVSKLSFKTSVLSSDSLMFQSK